MHGERRRSAARGARPTVQSGAGQPTEETVIARPISLFLDVDGTLIEFADHPDAVVIEPELVTLLAGLHRTLGAALALVSGRSIESLDRLFAPFRGTAVGVHGLEVRLCPEGEVRRADVQPVPAPLLEAIGRIAAAEPGAFLEHKGFAVAVHHRLAAPAMQALRRRLETACATHAPGFTVLRGRKVLEIKPEGATKAHGCDELMRHPPFRGTWPIAFGDDVTDLDMFEAIKRHGGTTVSVGSRIAGAADLQLGSPGNSSELLRSICAAVGGGGDASNVLELLREVARP
jgi:trehalose 6-phosphate phosphatase